MATVTPFTSLEQQVATLVAPYLVNSDDIQVRLES